jgi:hypothetical protein
MSVGHVWSGRHQEGGPGKGQGNDVRVQVERMGLAIHTGVSSARWWKGAWWLKE